MERPIRALFLNDTSRNGGPGRTLYYILKFLDTARIHRTVVLPREGVVSDLLTSGGVADELHFLPNMIENVLEPWGRPMAREDFEAPLPTRARRSAVNVGRGASAVFELRALLRKTRADVVFCNGTTANFMGGGMARLTRVPIVWHAFYPEVARPIAPLHDRLAASRGVRSILCVSRPVARQFAHCQEKVRIVHDGVDTSEYDPARAGHALRAELGLTDEHIVFGSQGRVLARKGYLEMVRAARLVVDRLPAARRDRARFVVIGDTPNDMRPNHLEECQAEVKKLGLESCFHFIGYRADVKPYVNDFSVAVVPSVYEDPLPRAVIESMSFAKPVVAFDVGGIPEMIDTGLNGLLVHVEQGGPPDVEGLAEAMVRYAVDPDLVHAHGREGRQRAVEHFDSRQHAARIEREILVAAGRDPAPARPS